jgi:uncharacterized protein
MTESGFLQLKAEVLQRLRDDLDPRLTYHSFAHTEDVLKQAERIAISERITDCHLLLLIKIAALFHDTGFLRIYTGHEEVSCEILRESLDPSLFSVSDIELMENMIMAAKLPQSPETLPEKIMCDADLDYLGREDFDFMSHRLKQEFLSYRIIKNVQEWDDLEIRFLESHLYFTDTSIKERCHVKMQHLQKLKQKLIKQTP